MRKLLVCPTFQKTFNRALKPYPKSRNAIKQEVLALTHGQLKGDVMPGFSPFKLLKLRMGLKSYRIGKRGGFRLIYLFIPKTDELLPLYLYKKGSYKKEHEVLDTLKEHLKTIIQERQNQLCKDTLV